MLLSKEQIKELESVFISYGLRNESFRSYDNDFGYAYQNKNDQSIRFEVRRSIQSAIMGDVYCEPYTYMPHIYLGCNSFQECLKLAHEWSIVTKYKLLGKPYYHKVFISHSSEDNALIGEFVDKVLRLACGLDLTNIVYTSRQSTGVELGEGIPPFIKEGLNTSSLILFMISSNYKKSEVCLNEMGAAWAMEKKTVSILLPHTPFSSLGWIKSLEKAIKIDDSEGLDKLYSMLTRSDSNIIEWNRQKELFLKLCRKWKE